MSGFQPSNRLLLLGAGATVGASFGFQPVCKPPLNRDFFTQLQRITGKHQDLLREVVVDVVELFGSNFELTLEDYFTQLEFLASTAAGLKSGKDGTKLHLDLVAKRDRLMAALSAVLEMSTNRAITGKAARGCEYHRAVAKSLKAGDTVISFNYDCVMDDALRREGARKWSARFGYGFPKPGRVEGAGLWDPVADPAASASETISLLKLHGSLNWQLPVSGVGTIKLKQRLHSQRGTPRFSIVPPEWNKGLRESAVFETLWKNAFRAIERAERIAIVGFSFTPTDLHAESLFRLALRRSKLKTLVIANPSQLDRERVRDVFSEVLLRRRAIVRQYDTLGDMAAAWPGCFEE